MGGIPETTPLRLCQTAFRNIMPNAKGNALYVLADMEEGYELQTATCNPSSAVEGLNTSTATADSGEGSSQSSIHKELAQLFGQARERFEAVGRGNFFG